MKSVFILTSEVNEYDQCGEYFHKVFFTKPSIEDLIKYGLSVEQALNLLSNGGGRLGFEHAWFFLREYFNEEVK